MRKLALSFGLSGIFLAILAATPARATVTVTYVSPEGSDANNCSTPALACATFSKAHTETTAGGVLRVIGPGSYGAVTITKAISIIADNLEGGIIGSIVGTSPNGAAIIVQAGVADNVYLNGIMIDQRGTTNRGGINFLTGRSLHVHNSLIRRTGGVPGIKITTAAAGTEAYVTDCVIADGGDGIYIRNGDTGTIKVMVERVRFENNGNGVWVDGSFGPGEVTVRDSVASGNSGVGFVASRPASGGQPVNMLVERSTSAYNQTGVTGSGPGAVVRIGDVTVTGNATGLFTSVSGEVIPYRNNKVVNNTTDGAPTGTVGFK